jgi:hypothetical protein
MLRRDASTFVKESGTICITRLLSHSWPGPAPLEARRSKSASRISHQSTSHGQIPFENGWARDYFGVCVKTLDSPNADGAIALVGV